MVEKDKRVKNKGLENCGSRSLGVLGWSDFRFLRCFLERIFVQKTYRNALFYSPIKTLGSA